MKFTIASILISIIILLQLTGCESSKAKSASSASGDGTQISSGLPYSTRSITSESQPGESSEQQAHEAAGPETVKNLKKIEIENMNDEKNAEVTLDLPEGWYADKLIFNKAPDFKFNAPKNKNIKKVYTFEIYNSKKMDEYNQYGIKGLAGEFYAQSYYRDQPESAVFPNHSAVKSEAYSGETMLGQGRIFILECDLPIEMRTDKYPTYDMVYAWIPINDEDLAYNLSISVPLGESDDGYIGMVKKMLGVQDNKDNVNKNDSVSDSDKSVIISEKTADIDHDGQNETVQFWGDADSGDSVNYTNMKLLIIKTADKSFVLEKDIFDMGFCPGMFIGDLTGDGIPDIFLCADSGGNGIPAIYNELLSMDNNKLSEIPLDDVENTSAASFNVIKDDTVQVKFKGINDVFDLPLNKYQSFLYKKIKSGEGRYSDWTFGSFEGNLLSPVDFDHDGNFELEAAPLFAAEYHSDIADADIVYKYSNSGWVPVNVKMDALNEFKSESDKAKQLTDADLVLGKLEMGLSYDEVLKIMGKPKKEERTEVADNLTGIELTYGDGTDLYICPTLNSITVSSNSYPTARGLVVGDPKEKVEDLYGEPDIKNDDSTGEMWEYYTDNLGCMSIIFQNNRINEIELDEDN